MMLFCVCTDDDAFIHTHCVFVFTDDALWQLQDFDAQSLISTLRPLERTSPRLLCRDEEGKFHADTEP
jgi:hypothetical protein